jgi:hypothetical protein
MFNKRTQLMLEHVAHCPGLVPLHPNRYEPALQLLTGQALVPQLVLT